MGTWRNIVLYGKTAEAREAGLYKECGAKCVGGMESWRLWADVAAKGSAAVCNGSGMRKVAR